MIGDHINFLPERSQWLTFLSKLSQMPNHSPADLSNESSVFSFALFVDVFNVLVLSAINCLWKHNILSCKTLKKLLAYLKANLILKPTTQCFTFDISFNPSLKPTVLL